MDLKDQLLELLLDVTRNIEMFNPLKVQGEEDLRHSKKLLEHIKTLTDDIDVED